MHVEAHDLALLLLEYESEWKDMPVEAKVEEWCRRTGKCRATYFNRKRNLIPLTELGQHWRSETVAELGGAVLLKILGFDHDADLGGCWEYIRQYARTDKGGDVLKACNLVLERTCEAVALILDTAEAIKNGTLKEQVA